MTREVTATSLRWHALLVSAWAYLRHELLYLCWAIREVSLLAPLALTSMLWARYWPPLIFALWLLLVMLIPFNLNRVMTLFKVPVSRQRQIMLGALLLTLFMSLRTLLYETTGLLDLSWLGELYRHFVEPANPLWGRDIGIFMLILFLWWRGLSLTGRPIDIQEMGLRLRIGSLILLPALIAITSVYDTPVLSFILLYFFVTLLAVSLTRAEQIALERSGHSYPIRARWLGTIALTSFLLVVASTIVALGVSGRGLEQVVAWTAPFWQALRFFLTTLVALLSLLALYLLGPLFWLVGVVSTWLRSLNISLPGTEFLEPQEDVNDVEEILRRMAPEEPLYPWVNQLILIVFVLLLLLLLYYAVSRFLGNRQLALTTEEGLGSATGEKASSRSRLANRLRRLSLWQQWRTAASIRRIYHAMSKLAADYGYPRPPAQTPYEYRALLHELWPSGTAQCDLITQAYVRIRYGELPESEEELEAVRAAWRHLRAQPPPDEDTPVFREEKRGQKR